MKIDAHQKHVFGHESGRYSMFWYFEKCILHEIARSSDLDYSRAIEPQNMCFITFY